MYRIFYTNFGYGMPNRFATLEAAMAYGKSKGFEFAVYKNAQRAAAWSPIGGTIA
jgi:hypothetical protein